MKYSHLRGSPLPRYEGVTIEGEGLRRSGGPSPYGHPLRREVYPQRSPIPARIYAKETGRMILEAIVIGSFVMAGLGVALVLTGG